MRNSLHLYTKKSTSQISTLLNYHSECLLKYRIAPIKTLSKEPTLLLLSENNLQITNIKQTLVINNFSTKLIDQKRKLYLHNIHEDISNNNNNDNTDRIYSYHKNQVHKNYKLDKQEITSIIHRHIKHF